MRKIGQAQYFKWFAVQFVLFFIRKHQHSFSSGKLCMQNMRKVNIKVHVGNTGGATGKQHRVFFYKTLHQMFRPGKIFDQLRGMVKNVKQKNAPGSRPGLDHVNIFAKGFIIVGRINRGVSVAFYIIIKRYFFITYQLLEIIPVPFGVGRPFFSTDF